VHATCYIQLKIFDFIILTYLVKSTQYKAPYYAVFCSLDISTLLVQNILCYNFSFNFCVAVKIGLPLYGKNRDCRHSSILMETQKNLISTLLSGCGYSVFFLLCWKWLWEQIQVLKELLLKFLAVPIAAKQYPIQTSCSYQQRPNWFPLPQNTEKWPWNETQLCKFKKYVNYMRRIYPVVFKQ